MHEANYETRIGLAQLRHFAISLFVNHMVRPVRTTGSRQLRPELGRGSQAIDVADRQLMLP